MVQEYLSLTPSGEDSPLALEILQIDALVVGLTSEVTMLMGFNNNTSRTLEGELNFPLPEVISCFDSQLGSFGVWFWVCH
jgi:hypothetical protein